MSKSGSVGGKSNGTIGIFFFIVARTFITGLTDGITNYFYSMSTRDYLLATTCRHDAGTDEPFCHLENRQVKRKHWIMTKRTVVSREMRWKKVRLCNRKKGNAKEVKSCTGPDQTTIERPR